MGQLRKINRREIKEIRAEEVERGTQNLIILEDQQSGSYYKIPRVEERVLLDVLKYERGEKTRSSEFISTIWEMLEVERLGEVVMTNEVEKGSEECRMDEPFFKDLSEVLEHIVQILRKLQDQSLKPYNNTPCKILRLESFSDEARLVTIINARAREFIPKDRVWQLCAGDDELIHYLFLGRPLLDIKTLRNTYDLVLNIIGMDWKKNCFKRSSLYS